jgi:hypothetical protein
MSHESLLWTAATEAADRIGRVVSQVVRALADVGINATLVEGSALSAELSSADDLVRRFASRASLSVSPSDLARTERTLLDGGWERTSPQGDMPLLRTASQHGRHLVFALLDHEPEGEGSAQGLHPSHPESVRRRNERLSRWRVSVSVTLVQTRSHQDDAGRTVTESFELGLVEAGTAERTGTVPA